MLFWVIVCLICISYYVLITDDIPHEVSDVAKVIKIDHRDTYDPIILKINGRKYVTYTSNELLELGDEFYVEALVTAYPKQTVPLGFNQHTYYKGLSISGKLKIQHMGEIKSHSHLFTLRENIIEFYQEMKLSPYVYLMIFGIDLDEDLEEPYQTLGMMHLLSLSGVHLLVLVMIIKKIYFYLDVPMGFQRVSILVIYGIFVYLHRFDFGVSRLLIMALLTYLNEHFEWRKSRLELIQISFLCLLILDYHLLFSQSFLILYLIITGLNLLEPVYRKYDGVTKRFVMGWLVYIILIPFQSELNLLALIFLPLLSLPIAGTLMISSVLTLIFPMFNPLFLELTSIIDTILNLISTFSFQMIIGKNEKEFMLIYYIVLIVILISKSKIHQTLIVILLLGLYIFPHLIKLNDTSITFLDVSQGDATIIQSKGCITVIDAYKGIYDYLKNHGIKHIDYLFLTHSDTDHIEEASDVIKGLKIDHLILSKEDHEYPNYDKKIKLTQSGDRFTCGSVQLNILAPLGKSMSTNDASIVIQTKIGDQVFLLTGDIEEETETKLVERYGHTLQSDVLKIAHHGSKTSTSSLFLLYVNPKVSIISVGRDNRYGFPHDDVIQRLTRENSIIYRTDLHGTICYEPTKKKAKWRLYLPF